MSGEDNRIAELARDCLVANISDARAFASGRDLSAWIGPVPKQRATGGKARAGSISKAGNRSLRHNGLFREIWSMSAPPSTHRKRCGS